MEKDGSKEQTEDFHSKLIYRGGGNGVNVYGGNNLRSGNFTLKRHIRVGNFSPHTRSYEHNSYDCYEGNRFGARNDYNDRSYIRVLRNEVRNEGNYVKMDERFHKRRGNVERCHDSYDHYKHSYGSKNMYNEHNDFIAMEAWEQEVESLFYSYGVREEEKFQLVLKSLSYERRALKLKKKKERKKNEILVAILYIFYSNSIFSKESEHFERSKKKESELENSEGVKENECIIEKQESENNEQREKKIAVLEKSEELNFNANETNSFFASESLCVQNYEDSRKDEGVKLAYKSIKTIKFILRKLSCFHLFLWKMDIHFSFSNLLETLLGKEHFIEFKSISCAIPRVNECHFNIANYSSFVI
ncbi:hypothetical protein M9H77_17455 [Catharanthus roseus]|uniref:Uncharacterized protein n=1 Tax=Catharanthus roseus TaxID=4058 RepID=A0ACC0B4P8_CATRO|nr:hypothetical protein M9H77_17455 [Catharanthus roseus]